MSIPRVDLPADVRPDTLAVREGLPRTPWGENSEALFLTSSFVHPDAATAAARFANEEEAFVYSRFGNPTVTMMERRLAALEGTTGCIGTASGMAAILILLMGAAQRRRPRGLLAERVRLDDQAAAGVRQVRHRDELRLADRRREWRAAMRPNTRLLFAEIADQSADRGLRHRRAGRRSPTRAARCWRWTTASARPALQQPVKFGADLVIHSGTKYLDGQGRVDRRRAVRAGRADRERSSCR